MQLPPSLLYSCPLLWQSMRGDECARDCNACQQTVQNISLLSPAARKAWLGERAGKLCIAYYTHLNGELATVESLQRRGSWKLIQSGAAGLAAGLLLTGSGCVSQPKSQQPVQAANLGSPPSDEAVVLVAFGMVVCPPRKTPVIHGPHVPK